MIPTYPTPTEVPQNFIWKTRCRNISATEKVFEIHMAHVKEKEILKQRK